MLVRSWNVFHGNTVPPGREARLERMVRLVSEDEPDVVCLQELPVWSLGRLDDWSGMVAVGAVASRPRAVLPELGRRLTVHHGLLRSAFTGQANAILVRAELRVVESQRLVLNPRSLRRRIDPPLAERAYWAKERRVCQAVRVALPAGGTGLLANLHATKRQRLADAELLRAGTFADALARPDELCVLAGDFNVFEGTSQTLPQLREWGFAGGGHGVDHILARGAPVGPVSRWPDERRREGGVLLSDHAPVEARVA